MSDSNCKNPECTGVALHVPSGRYCHLCGWDQEMESGDPPFCTIDIPNPKTAMYIGTILSWRSVFMSIKYPELLGNFAGGRNAVGCVLMESVLGPLGEKLRAEGITIGDTEDADCAPWLDKIGSIDRDRMELVVLKARIEELEGNHE